MSRSKPDIATLVRSHAFWADEVQRLKKLGSDAFFRCVRLQEQGRESCIEAVLNEYRDLNRDPYENIDFDEFYQNCVDSGEVCEHCQECRAIKAKRGKAGRRLGQVRSAMTRIGRRMIMEDGAA